jgi:hypothetical protein
MGSSYEIMNREASTAVDQSSEYSSFFRKSHMRYCELISGGD